MPILSEWLVLLVGHLSVRGNNARHAPEVISATYLPAVTFVPSTLLPFHIASSVGMIKWKMLQNVRQILISTYAGCEGQDVGEYAIMLAVVLVIVLGMVKMIGANASTLFSQVASGIQ